MIFLPKFCAFTWTKVKWCFGKSFLVLLRFLVKKAKVTFLKINVFLSKIFYQIKMQAAINWSSHLKKHQTLQYFQTTDFLCKFQKSHFSEIFENHQ